MIGNPGFHRGSCSQRLTGGPPFERSLQRVGVPSPRTFPPRFSAASRLKVCVLRSDLSVVVFVLACTPARSVAEWSWSGENCPGERLATRSGSRTRPGCYRALTRRGARGKKRLPIKVRKRFANELLVFRGCARQLSNLGNPLFPAERLQAPSGCSGKMLFRHRK